MYSFLQNILLLRNIEYFENFGLKSFFLGGGGCSACETFISQPGVESRSLAVKAQSPNHWTPGEFPKDVLCVQSNINVSKETLNALIQLCYWYFICFIIEKILKDQYMFFAVDIKREHKC